MRFPASKNITACALVSTLLASAVSAAGVADPSVTAPCTWHVRLLYHYQDAGPQGRHDTAVSLALESPMRCSGSGDAAVMVPDGPGVARGGAHIVGDIPHVGGAPGLRDTYDKAARWPQYAAPADARASAEAPAPSFVGPGLGTRVSIAAALTGAERTAIPGPSDEHPATTSTNGTNAPYTVLDPVGRTDRLDLVLFFDPLPGQPADRLGEIAQVPLRTRAALSALGGEAVLAFKGHLFGATTAYASDGNFSICYQRHLALAPAALDVDYCGWLTRDGQSWQPARLPPGAGDAGP